MDASEKSRSPEAYLFSNSFLDKFIYTMALKQQLIDPDCPFKAQFSS
ncbi:hypothetical protein NIES2104_44160 [Leptolyngbya sp. NIES-2104]|nr:hypothetical protein NIES2104_44160 [Leptolyngbya sp. NIES-2104]